ncbi:MAG TPA: GGDEF domain-containing protein [Pseudohaliea sp.]|nr:GGDEF domain-containing protein [Pseudohaliea sp.]
MIYQSHIGEGELFAAQLELLMQNGRVASMSSNFIAALAVVALLWPYYPLTQLLLWASVVLILLLLRSLHMSNALAGRAYQRRPKQLFWRLVIGALVTGGVWSVTYITVAPQVPLTIQYVLLLIIVLITTISLAVMVVVREYFLAFLFTSLFPIAWWSLLHLWEQPHNLLVGGVLLAVCALLLVVSNWIHGSFRSMIALSWEREAMARELGDLTGSLRDRNRQLKAARRQLTDLANIDELTGLGNRRLVNHVLRQEINRARRSQGLLSLILIDVDFFKPYNDSYGHPAGDEVLRRLGDILTRATSRAGEVAGRYGGEEFILILPGADADVARRTAERLAELVREAHLPHRSSGISDRVTVSQGVLTVAPDGDVDPINLIDAADAALYQAKAEGRNRIVTV